MTDESGTVVYESGYLKIQTHPETGETSPDGRLNDEDLANLIVEIDPATGAATTLEHGDDYNQRHGDHPVNLGLVNFGNEFLRRDETGHLEEVFVPFLSEHTDNTHSIPPLETASNVYSILIPDGLEGSLTVTTRLRFRAFPPRFLRLMAQIRPDLVNEAIVDRNEIVEMAQAPPATVSILGPVTGNANIPFANRPFAMRPGSPF